MRNVVLAILVPVLAVAAPACRDGRSGASAKPVVAVSVPPQAYFVEAIAGKRVEVEIMLPPGASPATHEPSIRQMEAISRAVLYVKVGHPNFPFERAWLDRILTDRPDLPVVDGSLGLRRLEGDPHVWVSPGCARTMAANIAAALSDLLPGERERFRENLEAFHAAVDELDADIRTALEGHRGKKFYVYHPAWGYFAEEYGLQQVAVEHDHKESSPGALADWIEHARADGARIVFVQPQFSRESAEMIAAEIGGRVVAIDPLGRDWPGNLAKAAEALRESFEE